MNSLKCKISLPNNGVNMKYRIEKDTMGEVQVPSDALWGAQTQRALENFQHQWN